MPKRADEERDAEKDEFEDEIDEVEDEDEGFDEEDDEEGSEEDIIDEDDDEVLEAVEKDEIVDLSEALFEEDAGYDPAYDWASLSESDREEHRRILHAGAEELEELNLKKLTLLDRWAAAQAYARLGNHEQFQEICRTILKARRRHEALLYEDIYLELISDLAESKLFEEAFEYLERFRKAYPDEQDIAQRVRGLLLIESGSIHEGKTLLDELMARADDHGELHLEIGDDLVAMGHPELALRILDRGKEFARRNKDSDLLSALDETRRLAQEQIDEGG